MGTEHDRAVLHAHQKIGETDRTPVQPTRRRYRLATALIRTVGVILCQSIAIPVLDRATNSDLPPLSPQAAS
jgi:hypothetical protein